MLGRCNAVWRKYQPQRWCARDIKQAFTVETLKINKVDASPTKEANMKCNHSNIFR